MATKFWSSLAQVMASYLLAPSHYLHQCWLVISVVLWHSGEENSTGNVQYICLDISLKITGLKLQPLFSEANQCTYPRSPMMFPIVWSIMWSVGRGRVGVGGCSSKWTAEWPWRGSHVTGQGGQQDRGQMNSHSGYWKWKVKEYA